MSGKCIKTDIIDDAEWNMTYTWKSVNALENLKKKAFLQTQVVTAAHSLCLRILLCIYVMWNYTAEHWQEIHLSLYSVKTNFLSIKIEFMVK